MEVSTGEHLASLTVVHGQDNGLVGAVDGVCRLPVQWLGCRDDAVLRVNGQPPRRVTAHAIPGGSQGSAGGEEGAHGAAQPLRHHSKAPGTVTLTHVIFWLCSLSGSWAV